ncbi:MAG: decaprenyl-phosphate phosphoribosyltransferase [Acidimicrobiaceae bacterium]|nr:decaprenyl-phosphate phosphoribosyltransferase [Acidimicrobiaceae bacterium]
MVVVGVDVTAMTESRAGWRSSFAGGLVGTARPKQWVKNLLVFAAPGAAGVLTHGQAAVDALAAFVIFCIVASGVYFINDALDVEADRAHPRKRFRPVAAGVIGARQAQAVGAALVTVGVALSALVAVRLLVVLAIYVGVQVAYSVWLKHEPVLDLAAVAAGFVLRAIAGAVAVGVPISQWFLIVATFGSLFMVTGKRISDLAESGGGSIGGGVGSGSGSAGGRAVAAYSVAFLRSVLVMSATVTITAYCLWAFENVKAVTPGEGTAAVCFQLSIVPFTLALMRYGLLVDQGQGGAPEDLVLGDRLLVVLAVIWAVVFAVGVYR